MSFDGTDTLRLYLDDIRRTRPIPREDETALFRLCREGNAQARERIIRANMRFVLKVALQYRNSPMPVTDLVNEGCMGLIRAIESYDPSMGLKFISYAVWWIKAFIVRAIDENELDDEVRQMLRMEEAGICIDRPIPGNERSSYAEVLPDTSTPLPDRLAEIEQMERTLRDLINGLPEQEAQVIQSIYGIDRDGPMTLREVSEMLEVPHERVRQIRDKAIRHLRAHNFRAHLREHLEVCG